MPNQLHCRIVHSTIGRIRILVPQLADDAEYASKLLWLTQSLDFVTDTRINPYASCLIVHHKSTNLSAIEVFNRLVATIQQAATFPVPAQIPVESPHLSINQCGIGWMLLATGAFAGMQSAIRYVSGSIHPFEIAFLSHLFGIVVLAPWLVDLNVLKTKKLSLHGLRAVIDTGATILLFAGLSLTPLAQANALGFTTPLFAMLGANLFLGEQMQQHNWVALLLGLVGTLIILRPGFEIVGLGSVLILSGSAAMAGVLLLLKILAQTESSLTSNAYTVLLLTPLTLLPALLVWQWPTLLELFWLAVVAVLMVIGQMAVAQAFKEADVMTVLPVDFVQLLWASWLGYILFAEVPGLWTWIGGLLIFVGSIYSVYGEGAKESA